MKRKVSKKTLSLSHLILLDRRIPLEHHTPKKLWNKIMEHRVVLTSGDFVNTLWLGPFGDTC